MCGRGRCSLAPERLERRVRIPRSRWRDRERYQPSYNIGPGGWLPIIRTSEDAQRELQTMKWGLMPSYLKKDAKLDSFRMFNARSERLTESPVYCRLTPNKRCVILLNGFYEWKKETSGKKQPYYIHRGEGKLIMLAGLYDAWEGEEGVLYTAAIITTNSSPSLRWLHARMPVILPNEEAVDLWLSTDNTPWSKLENLLEPYDGVDIEVYPVTEEMGKLSFQGEECMVDIRKRGLASFLHSRESSESDVEEEPRKKRLKIEELPKKRVKEQSEEEEIPMQKKKKVEAKLKKTVKKTKREDLDVSTSKRVKLPKLREAKKVNNEKEASPARRSTRLRSKSPQ